MTMTSLRLSLILVAVCVLREAWCDSQEVCSRTRRLLVSADVSLSSADKGRADGVASTLLLGRAMTGQHEIYLKFDLGAIDPSNVRSLALNLPVENSQRSSGKAFHHVIGLSQVEASWSENQLSWGARPKTIGDPIKWSVARAPTFMVANLTSWNPGASTEVALRLAFAKKQSTDMWTMTSREGGQGVELIVVDDHCAVTEPDLRVRQEGPERRSILWEIPAQKDTYLRDGQDSERNFGSSRTLVLEGNNPYQLAKSVALVHFEVPEEMRTAGLHAIGTAILRLTKVRYVSDNELQTIRVKVFHTPWNEYDATMATTDLKYREQDAPMHGREVQCNTAMIIMKKHKSSIEIDVTNELKEIVHKRGTFVGFAITVEGDAHVDEDPQPNLLPMMLMSRENDVGGPMLKVQQIQIAKK